ncbi:HEAT repeat domain-containing protein [Halopenitus sp. POP-27]|uniref:HEAT repeat domain-containing protein n=1 Tax=Halopenitus sp. POP-27 TaxID=2994425 RepID=UPI002469663C|nr:HEAT repeat domain-containing protein [Halopenitus sp. POP-27]
MSNGEDDADDAPEEASTEQDAAAPELPEDVTEESLTEYLDEIETLLADAETEADLDDVEALLDDAESSLTDADLGDAETEDEDEDAADPQEALESRIDDLRADLEDARGPYAGDVVASIETSIETIEDTEWTDAGTVDVEAAIESFAADVADEIDVDVEPETDDVEALVLTLESIAEAVADADLDADADADTIDALVESVETLSDDLEAAEEWDDLKTNEQLQAQGFYDVLGHYKDYPVEWSALKVHEQEGNVEMILLALDAFQSEFMERHCLEALERMGKRAATDDAVDRMLQRAGKREKPAIRILGKMAAEAATETLVEYVDEDSDPQLQKVTFKALGEIGATEAVQPLANKLEMENDQVRPYAARALGLLGDARAIEPLAETLESDDSDDVRAAAAWALRQIGTTDALEAVAEYTDERVFIVQTEAEKAETALETAATPT